MADNRMIGREPVVGIRPVIDARQGKIDVRGQLEEQTMELAQKAAHLIRTELKYTSGVPVKVLVAERTIGRVSEAAACQEEFHRQGAEITLTVSPCWCYGTETMDMDSQTIKGVWGFNGTERPGAVYLAAVMAAHAQKGLPAFSIYGQEVQDADDREIPEDVKKKILRFVRAAVAVASMKGKSYLQIGASCMGISGSQIEYDFFESYLGMRVESVDEVEVLRRLREGIYDKDEVSKALAWTRENCREGFDKNPEIYQRTREEKDKDWDFSVKTMCIIKDLMNGNSDLPDEFPEEKLGYNAIAAGFQGQRQWTDHYPNTDFAEALLNSSFDWNGVREPYILATENDSLNGAAMLCNKLLSGRAQMFSDVRTYWSAASVERVTGYKLEGLAGRAGGIIHLINSGASCLDMCGALKDENGNAVVKRFYEMQQDDIHKCLEKTDWCPADLGYFRGGGFSSRFVTESEMPVTMTRINLIRGLGPVMQIAEGYTVVLPEEVSCILWDRTDPTWPCTWFVPKLTGKGAFQTVYDVMDKWGANHGAISYGHIGADVITLCSILRIPVCMHNVDEKDIFRPACWEAFGMDKESQDYRACAVYGPRYR